MLEQDYLALSHNVIPAKAGIQNKNDINSLGSQIVREIVIPALTKEVNEGKNFAQLRQVFYSLILATWYKKKIKDSILNKVYSNQNKISGVQYEHSVIASEAKQSFYTVIPAKAGIHNKNDVETIYHQYLQAFKKGVYNYIKEDPTPDGQVVPRKYFSGGVDALNESETIDAVGPGQVKPTQFKGLEKEITDELVDFSMNTKPVDGAMTTGNYGMLDPFWLGEIEAIDITQELGQANVKSGTFPGDFKFERNGFQPGPITMGIGRGLDGDAVVMRRSDAEGLQKIIFERRRNGELVKSATWIKLGGDWIIERDYLMAKFWSGLIDNVDVTEELGYGVIDGKFPVGFRFERTGFQSFPLAIGIAKGMYGDTIIMRRSGAEGLKKVIFERWRNGELIKSAAWVKTAVFVIGHNVWKRDSAMNAADEAMNTEVQRMAQDIVNTVGVPRYHVKNQRLVEVPGSEPFPNIVEQRDIKREIEIKVSGMLRSKIEDRYPGKSDAILKAVNINVIYRGMDRGEAKFAAQLSVNTAKTARDGAMTARKSKAKVVRKAGEFAGYRIMIVDDGAFRGRSMGEYFQERGAKVYWESTYSEALDGLTYSEARGDAIHLIIAQSGMPQRYFGTPSAEDFGNGVRKNFPNIKIFFYGNAGVSGDNIIGGLALKRQDDIKGIVQLAKDLLVGVPPDLAMNAQGPGGIDFNPAQMSMQVKKEGEDFKFNFNGTEIDAAQVTGATFIIRTMTPVTDLPLILGLSAKQS